MEKITLRNPGRYPANTPGEILEREFWRNSRRNYGRGGISRGILRICGEILVGVNGVMPEEVSGGVLEKILDKSQKELFEEFQKKLLVESRKVFQKESKKELVEESQKQLLKGF